MRNVNRCVVINCGAETIHCNTHWFTYQNTSDFLHYIADAPNVHIKCEYFCKNPIVILLIYTCQ